MPFIRLTEAKKDSTIIKSTMNFKLVENTSEGEVNYYLVIANSPQMYNRLISWEIIGNSLEVHVLKEDLDTEDDLLTIGEALTELSEYVEAIKEL